jgi:nucleoside-diphosphate-sugar epimerase
MAGEVLVTGASGFIGNRLVRALETEHEAVQTFSRSNGDIATAELAFPEIDHVFHLAGCTFVADSWRDPVPFYRTNVLGAVNVLELCRRRSASLTLVSSYVYGRPLVLPVTEDHPLNAFNPYGMTKILAEQAARFYAEQHGVPVTIVRPFNVYGPGQAAHFLMPLLIRQALDPSFTTYQVADDRPRRDYLYVDDLIRLLLACRRKAGFAVYNAGSGSSVSIADLVEAINACTGARKRLHSRDEPRPDDVLDVAADIQRASRALGWQPATTLHEGIAATIAAVRASAAA